LRARLDFDAIADATGKPRFRLDISVLDKAGFKFSPDNNVRGGKAGLHIAARDIAADEDIPGASRMDQRRRRRGRLVKCRDRGKRLPRDGEGRKIKRAQRRVFADYERNRLAAKARDPFGKHRLIGEGGDNAETVFAGDVLGGEDCGDAGVRAHERLHIRQSETRVMMWRADRACE